jgi:hypothetical protein
LARSLPLDMMLLWLSRAVEDSRKERLKTERGQTPTFCNSLPVRKAHWRVWDQLDLSRFISFARVHRALLSFVSSLMLLTWRVVALLADTRMPSSLVCVGTMYLSPPLMMFTE